VCLLVVTSPCAKVNALDEKGWVVNLLRHHTDKAAWPEYHRWMMEKLEKSDSVFRSRVKDLDANAWQPEPVSGDT
jgi:hypothetical protein